MKNKTNFNKNGKENPSFSDDFENEQIIKSWFSWWKKKIKKNLNDFVDSDNLESDDLDSDEIKYKFKTKAQRKRQDEGIRLFAVWSYNLIKLTLLYASYTLGFFDPNTIFWIVIFLEYTPLSKNIENFFVRKFFWAEKRTWILFKYFVLERKYPIKFWVQLEKIYYTNGSIKYLYAKNCLFWNWMRYFFSFQYIYKYVMKYSSKVFNNIHIWNEKILNKYRLIDFLNFFNKIIKRLMNKYNKTSKIRWKYKYVNQCWIWFTVSDFKKYFRQIKKLCYKSWMKNKPKK